MNSKFKEIFAGKVVNKALTRDTGVDEFPRYVLEYLIDNFCKEESFHEDMSDVVRRLKENFVHGAEAEKIRHFIRERRHHTIIANLEARLVETEDGVLGDDWRYQRTVCQYPRTDHQPVPDASLRRDVGDNRSHV